MKKNHEFLRKDKCPYCDYPCDSAGMTAGARDRPSPGDLTFCIMCCEASKFNKNMKMQRFDINSIKDAIERNRIKGIQNNMILFWESNPDKSNRREKYLNSRDRNL